jgi:hypothetical protein
LVTFFGALSRTLCLVAVELPRRQRLIGVPRLSGTHRFAGFLLQLMKRWVDARA